MSLLNELCLEEVPRVSMKFICYTDTLLTQMGNGFMQYFCFD